MPLSIATREVDGVSIGKWMAIPLIPFTSGETARTAGMKILLAIDDSRFYEPAIQAVIARSHREDTEVRVLQVVKPPSLLGLDNMGGYDWNLAEDWGKETEQAQILVTRAAEALRAHGMKVTTFVEQGDSQSAIIDASREWPADLIVLGAQGGSGSWGLRAGGLPEAIVVHARCSVEIVRVLPGREGALAAT